MENFNATVELHEASTVGKSQFDVFNRNVSPSSHAVVRLWAPHSLLFLQLQAERRLIAKNIKLLNRHFDICSPSEASTVFTDSLFFNDVSFCFLTHCAFVLLFTTWSVLWPQTATRPLGFNEDWTQLTYFVWVTTCLMSVTLCSILHNNKNIRDRL